MDLSVACPALSSWHSDRLWPLIPQWSHFTDVTVTVHFVAALAFGFSLVLCQARNLLLVAWFPAHPAVASKLDRDLALGVALLSLLARAPFRQPFASDTILMALSWFMFFLVPWIIRISTNTLLQESMRRVLVGMLLRDCVVLPQLFLELVESHHDVVGKLEVEYRLVPSQVSALPLRLVLLGGLSPMLKSAIRVHERDLVRSRVLQVNCEDKEELSVAPVVPGTWIEVAERPAACDGAILSSLRSLRAMSAPRHAVARATEPRSTATMWKDYALLFLLKE